MTQDYAGEINVLVVFDRADPEPELLELASDLPRRSLQLITNSRTPGLAGARNSGILASSGDLIAFCDDDDEWLPGKVRAQVEQLSDPTTLTCVTGIRVLYSDREVVRIPEPESVSVASLARQRVMAAHPSTVMVRREALFGEIGLVDEEIPGSYGEDFDWILRAARAGGISVVERDLVKVRWGNSLFSRNWQTIADAIDFLLAKHPELRSDPKGRARLLSRKSFALAANGQRKYALSQAIETVRVDPTQKRTYLAIAVAARVISAERLLDIAHKMGRGI